MKQNLQFKLGQQLTMTPQLQQAIKLLQLSTQELQQEIQQILESNPMLDTDERGTDNSDMPEGEQYDDEQEEKPATTSDQLESESIPDEMPMDEQWEDYYQPSATSSLSSAAPKPMDDSDFSNENRTVATESLQDHLLWQLNLTPFSDRDRIIALSIIDAIEPDGLLGQTVDDIFQGLSTRWHNEKLPEDEQLEKDEFIATLHRIQQFDPPGVGAQDLQDCLLIQLNQLHPDTPWLLDAGVVIREHLDLLASHDYKTLIRKSGIRENTLKEAIKLIQSLNPQPGNIIESSATEYVIPDVFVSKRNDKWQVRLNPDIAPALKINETYAALIKRGDNSSDGQFLKNNLQEARWFLKSLESRNDTLLKVANAIVERQRNFLDYGEEAMKPLVLHDIAEAVEMHESTISRVTTHKYIHTPSGVYELKYFFSSHVATSEGGECSSTAIRALVKKLISAENPAKPLSDSKITKLLDEQGIKVARRTIAKYREGLNIPPSNERKRLV